MKSGLHKIWFKNRRGFNLSGRLHYPTGHVRAFALFAPCFTCTKDIKAARHICQTLSQRGVAALRIDFTGLNESEGDFSQTSFSTNVDDLIDAAIYLKQTFEPPQLLVGHSLGGTAAIVAASKLSYIKAVTSINSPCYPKHVIRHFSDVDKQLLDHGQAQVKINEKIHTFKKSFFDDLRTYDMKKILNTLDAALLICHAPGDTVVDIKNANVLFRFAKHPKSFLSLTTADHLILSHNVAAYIADMIAVWSAHYLYDTVSSHQAVTQ